MLSLPTTALSFFEIRAQAPLSAEQIVELYNEEVSKLLASTDDNSERIAELEALSKEELIAHILKLEIKKGKSQITAGALALHLLADYRVATTSNKVIAEAINKLLPGTEYNSDCVSSTGSKAIKANPSLQLYPRR